MSRSVEIVVPAYRPDVEMLAEYVEALDRQLDPETIRVELDAATAQVRDELSDLPVTVNAVSARRGKGAAITAGFDALDTDVLGFADADGSTPAADLARVVEAVGEKRGDLAVGSRRHPDAAVATHQTFARRRLGDSFAWLARQLLSVELYDYQCGAKALTASAWEEVRGHLYEPGFAWDVELIAMAGALGLRVEEVPIEWHDRPNSTVSPVRDSVRLARTLFGARHRAKQIRNSPLHTAIAQRRDEPTALVENE